MMAHRHFVPAAGYDWLLPLYDPFQRLLGARSAREQLIDAAAIEPGHRVLEIGCGTGDLLVQVLARRPQVEVVGLDPDPKALGRARTKLLRAGLTARLDRAFSDALPYADGAFDRVLSSFMLHHLERDTKEASLAEARRVLAPGGSLHVLDFGGDGSRRDGLLARLLHSHGALRDNHEGRIPLLMAAAGFAGSREVACRRTILGRVACYAGST